MATVDENGNEIPDALPPDPSQFDWQGPLPDAPPTDIWGGTRSPDQSDYLMRAMASIAQDPQGAIPSFDQNNPDQGGVDRIQHAASFIDKMTSPQAPTPTKTPWWVHAIGGATDLASILSYRHQTKARNQIVGTDEFGDPIHRKVRGQADVPQFVGPATFTMGMGADQRNQAEYDQRTAANRRAMIPGLMQMMGKQFGPPAAPKPPPVSAWLTQYRGMQQVDQENAAKGITTNIAGAFIKQSVADKRGNAPDKIAAAVALKTDLDEIERTRGKEYADQVRDLAGVNKQGRMTDPERRSASAASRAGLLDADEAFAHKTGQISPAMARTVAPIRASYASKIAGNRRLVAELEARRRQMVDLGEPTEEIDHQIERQTARETALNQLEEKAVRGALHIKPGVPLLYAPDSGGDGGFANDTPSGYDDGSGDPGGGNDLTWQGHVDPDLKLPDGSLMSDWTNEDLQELLDTDPEGSKALGSFVRQHALPPQDSDE